ncbi:MAG: filamentous hemagglutinin N-terminal domain-containing protein, partial [Gammaproteobacteria bacterium]
MKLHLTLASHRHREIGKISQLFVSGRRTIGLQDNAGYREQMRAAFLLMLLMLGCGQSLQANPLGPNVMNGVIDFASPDANTLQITNSPGAIINWHSFGIAPGEITQFIQQNADSAILNRVTGQAPSEILGQLNSNGRVYLINPNGIVIGNGAMIDTAG